MSLIKNEKLLDAFHDSVGLTSVKDLFEYFAHPEVTSYFLEELQRILVVGVDLGVITQFDKTHYTLPALINASDNTNKQVVCNEYQHKNLYLGKRSNLNQNLNNRIYHEEAVNSHNLSWQSYNKVEVTTEDKCNEDIKANSKSNPSCPSPPASPSPSRSPSPSPSSSSSPSRGRKQIQRRRSAGGTNRNRRTISHRKRNSAQSRSKIQRRRRR